MEGTKIPPEFLDILEKGVNGSLEDFSITLHPKNMKGDGFLSELIFLSLYSKNARKEFHLVIKYNNSKEDIYEMAFSQEIFFYNIFWPKVISLENTTNLQFSSLIPKCLAIDSQTGAQKIVLENLKITSYQTVGLKKIFDSTHMELIFRTYGKFHALSFAFKNRNPGEFEKLLKPVDDLIRKINRSALFPNHLQKMANHLRNTYKAQNTDEIKKILGKIVHKPREALEESKIYDGSYPVLNHGDCWCNNFLFKYDEMETPVDVKLIDFQLISTGSPVHDLSYAIYAGASKDIWDDLEHYLLEYHKSLYSSLAELGYEVDDMYPFCVLKDEWRRYCKFGFLLAIVVWVTKTLSNESDIPEDWVDDSIDALNIDFEQYDRICGDLLLHMYENKFL